MIFKQLVFLVLLFAAGLMSAEGKVIRVTEGQSIQGAINNASHGDTILIKKGLYKQHSIVVKKKLTIIGENFPVLDGLNKFEVLVINADSVTVQGLQIQNIGISSMNDLAGIKVVDHAYATIRGNKIINATYGVYLQNSTFCHVLNNVIRSNAQDELSGGNGVHAWKSTDLLIQNNTISGHRDGIYFEFVTGSLIKNNRSFRNIRYGLHFMFSNDDVYEHNTFRDNGAGVAVMFSNKVKMIRNTFYHNWGDAAYGLLLKEISDGEVTGNRFIKNTAGLFMEGTNRIEVRDNVFQDNGWALRVQASCSDNKFFHNNFMGNSFDAATNGTMMLNIFSGNYWDKYDGYDLDKDGIGDVPYYPVSAYSVITEQIPTAMILYRSFLSGLLELIEKVLPTLTPDELKDDKPSIKKLNLS